MSSQEIKNSDLYTHRIFNAAKPDQMVNEMLHYDTVLWGR